MQEDSVQILNTKVNFGFTLESAVAKSVELLSDGKCHYVCTTNPEFILEARRNPAFKDIINESDLSLPDGVGVLYAKKFLEEARRLGKDFFLPLSAFLVGVKVILLSFIQKGYLGERVSGVAFVEKLCGLNRGEKNYSLFFLGGWPKNSIGKMLEGNYNIAEKAANALKVKYPRMNIVGATSSFGPKEEDDTKTLAYIKDCMSRSNIDHIDILFVAYGHPKQELWIKRLSSKIPVRLSIGVGGSFDYFSGIQKQAPAFFIMSNLEWLFRLVTQPWRFKRTVSAFLYFPFLVYKSILK